LLHGVERRFRRRRGNGGCRHRVATVVSRCAVLRVTPMTC
jgi:hypothetical protein